jgi:hypothetical protein
MVSKAWGIMLTMLCPCKILEGSPRMCEEIAYFFLKKPTFLFRRGHI